jgi:hypothetical protein
MYKILKHLSACLINIDIGLMHHQSLPLVVEKSFDWAPAACSSRARQPHLTQRLQQHLFPTAGLWRCGACKASSIRPGIARHVLHSAGGGSYARFSCRFICAAAANLSSVYIRNKPCAVACESKRQAGYAPIYGNLAGANMEKMAAK